MKKNYLATFMILTLTCASMVPAAAASAEKPGRPSFVASTAPSEALKPADGQKSVENPKPV